MNWMNVRHCRRNYEQAVLVGSIFIFPICSEINDILGKSDYCKQLFWNRSPLALSLL